MKRTTLKHLLAVAFLATAFAAQAADSSAQANATEGTTTLRYTADFASVIPNPERGWHNRRDVDGRGGNDVRDFSDVKAAGHTLVHSYLRLDDFKDTDTLSASYLADLQKALDAIRASGLKIILRPSHDPGSARSHRSSQRLLPLRQK